MKSDFTNWEYLRGIYKITVGQSYKNIWNIVILLNLPVHRDREGQYARIIGD